MRLLNDSQGQATLVLTKSALYHLDKRIGQGATSIVYRATCYPFSGDSEVERVLKISKKTFGSQASFLSQLSPRSQRKKEVDHILNVYDDGGSFHMAVQHLSECDLTQFDYTDMDRPVTFILHQLIHWIGGIASLHRQDLLHRDIKGANLLINRLDPGSVTDFGYLGKVSTKNRRAFGTPSYIAPFSWETLADQYDDMAGREEKGVQGKASDLFSFGRVLLRDVLYRLAGQFLDQPDIAERQMLGMRMGTLEFFGERQLQEHFAFLEKTCGKRVVLSPKQGRQSLNYFRFPNLELVCAQALNTIDQLARERPKHFDATECEKLQELVELATGLQSTSREGVCEFLGVAPNQENESDLLAAAVMKRLKAIQESGDNRKLEALECSCTGQEDRDLNPREVKRAKSVQ
jgi:serine/threonine protein kinase